MRREFQAEEARSAAAEAALVAEAQRSELRTALAAAEARAAAEAEALREARASHEFEVQQQRVLAAESILRAEGELERKLNKVLDRITEEKIQVGYEPS